MFFSSERNLESVLEEQLKEVRSRRRETVYVFGSYAVHKDPKSEADLVCQSVSMFEDEMTRDRSPRAYK